MILYIELFIPFMKFNFSQQTLNYIYNEQNQFWPKQISFKEFMFVVQAKFQK